MVGAEIRRLIAGCLVSDEKRRSVKESAKESALPPVVAKDQVVVRATTLFSRFLDDQAVRRGIPRRSRAKPTMRHLLSQRQGHGLLAAPALKLT